jgi:ABC-type Co2+ transport system permease subunit
MEESVEQKPTDYTGIIIAAALLPVLFFFSHIGKTNMGLNVFICLFINLFAIKVYWKSLRKHVWFWCVIVFILALHVPVILRVQWPHEWVPAIALLPIGVVDFLIYVGVISFVQKFLVKASPLDEEA